MDGEENIKSGIIQLKKIRPYISAFYDSMGIWRMSIDAFNSNVVFFWGFLNGEQNCKFSHKLQPVLDLNKT